MKRAAIYARISRDREGAGLGVARQEADCRELAATRKLTISQVFTDNDISAYSGKPRPGYRALLAAIEAGSVDIVLVWHTDRLHRSPAELEAYINTVEPRGVATVTVKTGPLDLATPAGRLVARQLGAVARFEVDHMVERQQSAKAHAAAAGKWKGGRRPFGYELDGVTVRPDEAATVVFMTDEILTGASVRGLSAELNRRDLTTSTGAPWRPDAVRAVLLRPRNAGLMEHRRQIIGQAQWPALVPEDRWRAVVSALTAPGRRTQWSSARAWLLSGLVLCGLCGSTCHSHRSARAATPDYKCSRFGHLTRNAVEVDSYVTRVTLAKLDSAELVVPETAGNGELSAAHTELLQVRQRLDDLGAAFGAGQIDARQLAAATQALRGRAAQAEAVIAASASGSALAAILTIADIRHAWDELPLERRRAIIDSLMVITLLPSRKGRPRGWRPGESYFDPETVAIGWRQ